MNTPKWISLLAVILATTNLAAQEIHPNRTYPRFAVGITGIYATIEKGYAVTVVDIHPQSPAQGKLHKGDVLHSVQGEKLAVTDPRVLLGNALSKTEGTDGKLRFGVKRGGKTQVVIIQIPVSKPYRRTWPLHCQKSQQIVKATAAFVAKAQRNVGSYSFDGRPVRDGLRGCLASLFLLSTGDPAYAPHIKRHAHALASVAQQRPTTSAWHLGYQGIFLAEYYLHTGDRTVLPGLKSLCDQAMRIQAAGAWGHGRSVNPGYVQSGLMNSAGVPY